MRPTRLAFACAVLAAGPAGFRSGPASLAFDPAAGHVSKCDLCDGAPACLRDDKHVMNVDTNRADALIAELKN